MNSTIVQDLLDWCRKPIPSYSTSSSRQGRHMDFGASVWFNTGSVYGWICYYLKNKCSRKKTPLSWSQKSTSTEIQCSVKLDDKNLCSDYPESCWWVYFDINKQKLTPYNFQPFYKANLLFLGRILVDFAFIIYDIFVFLISQAHQTA